MGVLQTILAAKRDEIARLRQTALPPAPERRPLALKRGTGDPLRLIAEIKFRSPSAGPLSTRLSVAERARAYERAGASMVSVLCDTTHFDGSFQHLRLARESCGLPLLCKDFVIDEVQLDAARAFGADAVLLIACCLDASALQRLIQAARERQLQPFVEVASEDEARLALSLGADLVGVNARDLDTLRMDLSKAQQVLADLPDSVTRVHLSGLKAVEDVAALASSRADAALLGEALMRHDDPEPLLAALVARAHAER